MEKRTNSSLISPAAAIASGLVVALLAITNHSLWIDELMTVFLAKGETLAEYHQRLGTLRTSDNLMPIYMTYLHFWENMFGQGEFTLRCANVPWFLLGVGSLWHLLRDSPRLRLLSLGLLLANPFTWYYLNEARPYAMQIGTACAVMACATRIIWSDAPIRYSDYLIALFSLVAMSGASLLSIPWTGLFVLLLAWAAKTKRITASPTAILLAAGLAAAVLLYLAYYYFNVLKTGARAATAFGGIFQGLAFSVYELMGFTGLGPGRDDLRQNGTSAFSTVHFGTIAFLAIVYAGIAIAFLKSLGSHSPDLRRRLMATIGLLLPGLLFFVVVGFAKDFRVLGRHFAPLAPAIAIATAAILLSIRSESLRKPLVAGLFLSLITSTILIRLAPRHLRDDYRQASDFIVSEYENRRDVLWVANLAGLSHYDPDKVPRKAVGDQAGMHTYVFGDVRERELPRRVLISKPDIHDPHKFTRKLLKDGSYRLESQFPGFEVWVR